MPAAVGEAKTAEDAHFWFPGRWVGGATLVLAPLVLLTGMLLRLPFHFFFPQQLAAYRDHPTLVTAAYSAVLAGYLLLWPAILTLAHLIGARRPGWAVWGGVFVVFGLFARTFHAGIDHLAFQLVRFHGVDLARDTVARSYGGFHIVATFNGVILTGWLILAIGAYLSGTLGKLRALALASMAALMIGVLKGSSVTSVVVTAALGVALVPLGVKVLATGPAPRPRAVAVWSLAIAGLIALLFVLGRMG